MLTFLAGVVVGAGGLLVLLFYLAWRAGPIEHLIRVERYGFYKDVGDHYDPTSKPKKRSGNTSDAEIEEALRLIHLKSLEGGKASDKELERIRVHEAGHAVILLDECPEILHYVVGEPHYSHIEGEYRGGVVRHDATGNLDLSMDVAYGGIVAEELILGYGFVGGAHADLVRALVSAQFVTLPPREVLEADDLEFWHKLGLCDPALRDPEAVERTLQECQVARERVRKTLTRERAALLAIAEALKIQSKLSRKRVLEIWDQHKSTKV